MELWIRSKDKERIIKVNNIFIHQDNNHLICANQRAIDQFNDESFELGAYSSRKRALEVLDEIQRQLIGKKGLITTQDKKGIEFIPFTDTVVVYEMPKE